MPVYTFRLINNSKYWYKNGNFHRDCNLPAIAYYDGDKCWAQNGKLHRNDDLPAMECSDSNKKWWKNGNRYFLKIKKYYI